MGRLYSNPHESKLYRGFSHFLLWRFGYYNDPYPHVSPPEDFIYPNGVEVIDYKLPKVTWVNHSSYWIEAKGKSILVDPVWNERCSPVPFIGPKRRHPPEPPIHEIKKLDYVIITHNHYDHLDKKTVKYLKKQFPEAKWIVPEGVGKGFLKGAIELGWWESCTLGEVTFTGVPAQHFSGRGLFDRNRTLWMGCVIDFGDVKVYCAGDTGYNEYDFKEIGDREGPFDLSLLPIGIYSPRRFMRAVHINPAEAVQIHLEVGSRLSVGGHWKTFRLASEKLDRPPFDLYCALMDEELCPSTFRVLDPGQTINWGDYPLID